MALSENIIYLLIGISKPCVIPLIAIGCKLDATMAVPGPVRTWPSSPKGGSGTGRLDRADLGNLPVERE
jgi:hypothetical protein